MNFRNLIGNIATKIYMKRKKIIELTYIMHILNHLSPSLSTSQCISNLLYQTATIIISLPQFMNELIN